MHLARLFIGNFAFEHELAGRPPEFIAAKQSVRQVLCSLSAGWIAIAEPPDVILTPEPIEAEDFEELDRLARALPRFVALKGARPPDVEGALVPWGASAAMLQLARDRGWSADFPPADVVQEVNSRRERFHLERLLASPLPGMQLIESVEQLEEVVAGSGHLSRGWVLKANFGMAGRESVRGRGTPLSEPTRRWAAARLEESGCVIFEPMVAPIAEAGIQLEIPRSGEPALVGIVPQIVGKDGTYRGSRFGNPDAEIDPWQPAVPIALAAASHLQKRGYFGPLGIDAMWYRDADGQAHLRPLQDVNARFTMGRLALGWTRWLPEGWCGSWLPTTAARPNVAGSFDASQVRVVEPFPRSWKNNGGGSTLIVASSPTIRAEIERQILQIQPPAD